MRSETINFYEGYLVFLLGCFSGLAFFLLLLMGLGLSESLITPFFASSLIGLGSLTLIVALVFFFSNFELVRREN